MMAGSSFVLIPYIHPVLLLVLVLLQVVAGSLILCATSKQLRPGYTFLCVGGELVYLPAYILL